MTPVDQSLSTPDQILDLACEMTQTRGYNGFSFRDLAAGIGIRSASIHYHFPTKADLGRAMARRYRDRFAQSLSEIGARGTARAKLEAYFDIFRRTVTSEQGVCLGAMMASEALTLMPPVQEEIREFFEENEAWLAEVLRAGAESGELNLDGSAENVASAVFSALQGAMVVSRACEEKSSFQHTCDWLLRSLCRE